MLMGQIYNQLYALELTYNEGHFSTYFLNGTDTYLSDIASHEREPDLYDLEHLLIKLVKIRNAFDASDIVQLEERTAIMQKMVSDLRLYMDPKYGAAIEV